NPYWYQFTCYQTGTLGFLITPNQLGDDYDWELFDITGHNPNDVYSDPSLYVSANWSGSYGITGTSATAPHSIECASVPGDGIPTYSTLPTIIVGHKYLLLISHYTQSQSGYSLSFGGGTASITDPTIPVFTGSGYSPCGTPTISIKMNKKVRCNTLAADGSDFSLSTTAAKIISAKGFGCDNAFDFDSVLIFLDTALAPGNYSVVAKNGSDGNTLLDDCNNSVVVGDNISFAISAIPPTPFDSISAVGCAPSSIQLVFSKPIRCNTIASDGSDFSITGSTPVTIKSAQGLCGDSGVSNTILLELSSPIYTAGTYQVTLLSGDDGNSVIDECYEQLPPGQTLSFTTKDTVSAQFSYSILYGCNYDTVQFANNGGNGINSWRWLFDSTASSTLQSPVVVDSVFGNHTVLLIVSNGVCSDTSGVVVPLDNTVKAIFSAPDHVCPTDYEIFQNSSIGNIISWNWNFGDGTTSTDQNPLPHLYVNTPNQEVVYNVSLIVENNIGCYDTAMEQITKVKSCYIDVPSAFTPNGDGYNDYLYPLNAYKATNLDFKVFNRYGQLVYETKDWTKKWDGTLNGKPQDIGTYVWMLQYTDTDSGKRVFKKGTTVLIR
ncbi:MAG: gliding motility-associated C-terminal domain-containing protein, partial [Bacteroidetes bacterium]|nr:gliding motility-associated C-terminal domain-containing protein [Bacteroidota bacterium]